MRKIILILFCAVFFFNIFINTANAAVTISDSGITVYPEQEVFSEM